MKISEVIEKLEELKKQHGDLNCVVSENHDYWGTLYTYLDPLNLSAYQCTPKGPKSSHVELAVVFSFY